MTQSPDKVLIAAITGAHGIRGQIKVKSFASDPDTLRSYKHIFDAKGNPVSLRFQGETKQGLIASIKGVNDRNQAELLRGTELFVARDALPPADEGEFYYDELIGMTVVDAEDKALGQIRSVDNYGAGDMIEIEFIGNGERELYAFTEASFPKIDVKARRVTFTPPEVLEARETSSPAS